MNDNELNGHSIVRSDASQAKALTIS
jgi:hypothetical protein